ncbi:MAG: beta-glucosidase BglX, partial [Candidatus Cryptobacteroides sp.]
MKRFALIISAALVSALSFAQNQIDIDELMSRMTLEEKVGQMNQLVGPKLTGAVSNSGVAEKIKAGMVGSILNVRGASVVELQRIAVEQTRLGIPLVFGLDVIHGYETCFPIPLAMASSWNLDLIEEASRIAGAEASRDGIAWTFTPMCDICREPRWGRIAEGAGEDPYLGAKVAAAQVRGFQGNLDKPTDIAACVKHFALYGAPQAGRDYYTVDMSRQQMFNEYLPPYRGAIEAGALTAMSSFNEFEAIPMTGHKYMLDTLLRKRLDFNGMLVTDYAAVNEMLMHGFAADLAEASILAANAGVDMDMVSEGFSGTLVEAVRKGLLDEAVIDRSCRRVLELKQRLGLFENPYKYCREDEAKENGNASSKASARRVASRSIVLLRNEPSVLPMSSGRKIALIGPLADRNEEMLGCWSLTPKYHTPVSLLEGLRNRFGSENVSFARGCHILDNKALENKVAFGTEEERGWNISDEKLRKEALSIARRSDIIVAAMGESTNMSGEGASRSDISLPAPQRQLLKELVALGKPVVLVVMAGRPLVLDWESENVDAIVYAWHLGSEAGNAIADVLSGDVNPSGRLTVTFPRSVGQIPIFYNHKNTGRPHGDFVPYKKYTSCYIDVDNSPLYPFGYGLGYANVEYSCLSLSSDNASVSDTVYVNVNLNNTSMRNQTETVQLYVHDKVASITRPVKELKGFAQVEVAAGKTVTVTIPLPVSELGFYDNSLQYKVEPGDFDIMVGPSSRDEDLLVARLR